MNLDKINELVATRVMGWHKFSSPIWDGSSVWSDEEDNWHGDVDDFNPSENIRDAWAVVEKFDRIDVERENGEYFACIYNGINSDGSYTVYASEAKTAPMAICLATLESVGVEIEVGEE